MHPGTLKRLVATQAVRTPSAAAAAAENAIQHMLVSKKTGNKTNESAKASSRNRLPLHAYNSVETQSHLQTDNKNTTYHHESAATTSNSIDYYSTSSFETALNQVLRLELDCPSRTSNSHHGSMETCVRDFFKV